MIENIYSAPANVGVSGCYKSMPMDLDWKKWLFSFKGRMNRKQFWLFYGPYLASQLLVLVDLLAPIIITIVFIWPICAVQVKRWHDLGKSGWHTLTWFVPGNGWLFVVLDAGLFKGGLLNNKYGRSLYKNA